MAKRNKYAGQCYRCRKTVQPGDGHFERILGGWRVQHASCAVIHRFTDYGKTEHDLEMDKKMSDVRHVRHQKALKARLLERSQESGRSGGKARKKLREMGVDFPTPPHMQEVAG